MENMRCNARRGANIGPFDFDLRSNALEIKEHMDQRIDIWNLPIIKMEVLEQYRCFVTGQWFGNNVFSSRSRGTDYWRLLMSLELCYGGE